MPCDIMLWYVILCYAIQCNAMWCNVTSRHITSRHIICHVVLCRVMLCHVMSCHVMLYCLIMSCRVTCYVRLFHVEMSIVTDSVTMFVCIQLGEQSSPDKGWSINVEGCYHLQTCQCVSNCWCDFKQEKEFSKATYTSLPIHPTLAFRCVQPHRAIAETNKNS